MSWRNFSRIAILAITATLVIVSVHAIRAADTPNAGSVQGVVKSASGEPVVGAFVKLKNNERHLTFMVISQMQGRYQVNDLPDGQYTVQGVGNGFQSDWSAAVDVTGGKISKVDLSLTTKQGAMLPAAWPWRVPEAQVATMSKDLPDVEGKPLVQARCTVCHTAERIVISRMDREHWQHTIAAMRANMHAMNMPDITDAEATQILNYVSTNFSPAGPIDPNSRLPRSLMRGEALHYRVVQYTNPNGYVEPHDVAVDPKGNGWVAERAGKIARFNPTTLEFTEIQPPPGPAKPENQRLGNPQINAKGIMWFPDGPNGRWLSYDTNTGKFEIYEWPKGAPGAAGGNSITLHPNGTIWETSGSSVRMLNPATKEWKFFDAPTYVKDHKPTGNYGIAVAGDGGVWFAESEVSQMGRIDPATGKVEEFKIPYDGVAFPRRMNSDLAGNIWVGLWNAGRLMKIDYETNKMTVYTPPTQTAGNYSVSVDKVHNLIWVSEQQVDKIARFDPKTGQWVEFPLPEAQSDPRRIEVDPHNPNRIWWTGDTSARTGFIELLASNNKASD